MKLEDKIKEIEIPEKRGKNFVNDVFSEKRDNGIFGKNELLKDVSELPTSIFASLSEEEILNMVDIKNRPDIFKSWVFEDLIRIFGENGDDLKKFRSKMRDVILNVLEYKMKKSFDVLTQKKDDLSDLELLSAPDTKRDAI